MPIRSQQKPSGHRREAARDGSQFHLQRARASSQSARGGTRTANIHTETLSDTFELLQRPRRQKRLGSKQRILLKSKAGTNPRRSAAGPPNETPELAHGGSISDREFDTLQHRYRLAITDNRKLKSDNRYLHHKSQDLRSELEHKKRVDNELRESEKRLQQRLTILNGELDKQRRINATRIEDQQMLKNRLKVIENMHKRKIADLYRTIRNSSKGDAGVNTLAPRASYESADVANSLRVQVKEAHDRLEVLTKELADEKAKRNTVIDELQTQYEKQRARLQEAIHSKSSDLSSERTKHQEAKVEIHRMKRTIDTLKAQVGEGGPPSRAVKNLKKTIAKLNTEIEEHNRESAKLKLSVRNMNSKYEENQRRLKYSLKDLDETRNTLSETREKYGDQIQELRTDIINEKKERRKMEAKYESLRDMANASGGGSLPVSDVDLDKFAKEKAKFEDMDKQLREALKQMNRRMKENERQNHKTKALYQKLIQEKGALENKSLSQEMELDHFRDLCVELETENGSLNKKLGALQQEQSRVERIGASDDQIEALNKENVKLMRNLSDLQIKGEDSEQLRRIQRVLEGEPQLKGFDPDKAVKVLAQQARMLRQSQAKLENKLREESIKFEQEKIKLSNQVESLNEELQDMSIMVNNATESSTDTKTQIQDLVTEKRIIEEKLNQYEQSVLLQGDGSDARVAGLEERIGTLQRQKEDIAKEYADRMTEWESERISQETNDVSVRTMIFALKREIESSNREKEATEHELVLFKQRFEEVQRLLAAEGYEIEYQGDDAEFYDEAMGRGGPGVFVEGYEEECDDEEAEEYMDEYFDKLRDKLRHELVGYVPSSSELEDVEYVLSKIEMLGLRNQTIEVKKLRPEDLKAVTNIKKQFDALPVLEGYLEKYSPHLFAGWQRRWVVVRDYYLFWAKKEVVLENNVSPLGSENKGKFVNHIPLLTVQKIVKDDKEPGKFVVKGQDRKSGEVRDYIWRIPSTHGVKERRTWIEGLEKHISHLQLCMQWVTTARSLNKSSTNRQSIRYASSPARHIRSKRSSQLGSISSSGGSPLPDTLGELKESSSRGSVME